MTRVFIISSYPMFGRGLTSLLRQESELDIMGEEADLERAIERVRALQPDVVILDDSSLLESAAPAAVLRILQESSDTRVVGLSLQDNNVRIYQASQSVIKDLEDLRKAVVR